MAETPLAALHADLPDATAITSSGSAFVDGVKDIAFGSVAGMVSKVFEHPFDLCKVRLQAQVLDDTVRFKGPIDCLTQTWQKEGIRGLYRGLPAPIVGATVENAILFLSYGQIQHAFRFSSGKDASADLGIGQKVAAGAGAGAITSFFLTPIELVKCKMQVQMLTAEPSMSSSSSTSTGTPPSTTAQTRISTLPGPIQVFKNVLRTNGVRGLWLGQTGTLLRETGGCAAWFGTKEFICDRLVARRRRQQQQYLGLADSIPSNNNNTRLELKEWESALAGACAGVSYNVVLFPADSVKSALQTEEELRPRGSGAAGDGARRTFWGMARAMYASQGIRGLYAGMGITVARAIPSSAMIFLIYDGLSKRFA